MYNLLVKGGSWVGGSGSYGADRIVTYTDDNLKQRFASNGVIDYDSLKNLPCLFVEETNYQRQQFAYVGRVTNVRLQRLEVTVQFSFDSDCPPIRHEQIVALKDELHIEFPRRGFDELSTTHWAVKNVDLFSVLFSASASLARSPKVFTVPTYQAVRDDMVSVMMPFAGFNDVYEAIQRAVAASKMECLRADNVWEHAAIIQDIVQIIDEASIVICDCTGRNANVFYEIGIAHSLGKEVILITQSKNDIPFDLQHLRYIPYLNNSEGLLALSNELTARINKLRNG